MHTLNSFPYNLDIFNLGSGTTPDIDPDKVALIDCVRELSSER